MKLVRPGDKSVFFQPEEPTAEDAELSAKPKKLSPGFRWALLLVGPVAVGFYVRGFVWLMGMEWGPSTQVAACSLAGLVGLGLLVNLVESYLS